MCYQIPGEITTDGEPILGGGDIDPDDHAFAATIYPKPVRGRAASGRAREKDAVPIPEQPAFDGRVLSRLPSTESAHSYPSDGSWCSVEP